MSLSPLPLTVSTTTSPGRNYSLGSTAMAWALYMAGMIAHQYERNAYLALYLLQLGEKQTEAHAIAQGTGRGCLYDGTVGERVAERYAHLYHGYATTLQREDYARSVVCRGAACTEIQG